MSTAEPADICRLRVPAHPRISPRGDQTVAVVQTVSAEGDRYQRHLARWTPESSHPDFVPAPSGELVRSPRFSHDGSSLAFLAAHDGRSTPWTLPAKGHRPRPLPCPVGSAQLLEWCGDSELLLVVDTTSPDRGQGLPLQVSWLRYRKEGSAGFTRPQSEFWLVRPDGHSHCLHTPPGSVSHAAVAPGRVAYTVEPIRPDTTEQWVQVRVLDLQTGEDHLWWDCPAPVTGLAIAPHGERIAVVTTGTPGHGPDAPRLWILDEPGGPYVAFPSLEAAMEYSVQGDTHTSLQAPGVHFASPESILFAGTDSGDVRLLSGHLPTGAVTCVSPEGACLSDFSPPEAGRVAMCLETPDAPPELFLADLAAPKPDARVPRVSELNVGWRQERTLRTPETISAVSGDGTRIAAQLYMPPAAGPRLSVPLFVRIHGGPHLCYGSGFDLETQVEIGAGFAVLRPNLRGSSGQGHEFRAASVGEWGRRDYEDLVAIVDEACRLPSIDADRVYLAGGSYGGYLTNWAITRTHRFRAAVSERSVSNLISKYGTADNGFSTNKAEMGGADIFDDTALLLLERSPIRHANSVDTPLLLIHGEADQRCPIEQSEQFFVALRRLGKDVTFVRFPDEDHRLPYSGRPENRFYRLMLILEWIQSR